jgi:C-terminal processing protease CtpA/Prc
MTLPDGTRFEADLGETLPRNDALSYKGPVYVLVDRFSFSNAAIVAAIVQDYDFGTLIGEETSYVPSSCGAIHTFTLPHTEQTVVYSKACSIRPNGDTAMRGVVPDVLASDDLFTDADEILEKALALSRDKFTTE